MTIFSEQRVKEAVTRLAHRKLDGFVRTDSRAPFSSEELTCLWSKVFIPYTMVVFMRRLSMRGHEVDGVRTPEQIRGFGVW